MAYSISEFESLYTGIFPPAMKLAMSLLHDESEARDAVQEVMMKLWESEVVIVNPQAFVLRSVRNTCINAINSKQVRERVMQKLTLDTVEVDEAEPEQRSPSSGAGWCSRVCSRHSPHASVKWLTRSIPATSATRMPRRSLECRWRR